MAVVSHMKEYMEKLKKIIDWLIHVYRSYQYIILSLTSIASIILGYCLLGPFMNSDEYKWFKKLSEENHMISELVNVQRMLADKLIASTIPLFVVWTVVLTAYCLDRNRISVINESSRYLAFFTGGTAFIVMMLGFTFFGICMYLFRLEGYSHIFLLITSFSLVVVAGGFFMKRATKLEIVEKNGKENKLVFPLLISCVVLGGSAYIYGLLGDPIQYWRVVHEAYNMANN